MAHCDIVIPVWNQLEATKACLESIIENTDYPYRVIIVDNKSDEPTASFLRSFGKQHSEKVLLMRSEENLGYIKGTNLGMKASTGDYVCLLNNDTVVYPGWLSAMVRVAELELDIGIVNPASNHFDISSEEADKADSIRYKGMGKCVGFCMLIKREIVDRVGYLDERFGMGYGEDDAYCISARNEGYRCVMARGAYVYHHGKKSFGRDRKAKEFRERQRGLATELLGPQLRLAAFLSGEMTSNNSSLMLNMLGRLADRGVKSKVILRHPPAKFPFEHDFVRFERQSAMIFYISAVYRLLLDGRFQHIVTDDAALFNLLSKLNLLGKKMFFLNGMIYDEKGQISSYDDAFDRLFAGNNASSDSKLRIAVITPLRKEDYLANTILDGLDSLQSDGREIEYFISSKYPAARLNPTKDRFLKRKEFIKFAGAADIIFLIWGKKNTDYDLAEEIGEWGKTVFIDGSELGGNKRLDTEIEQLVNDLTYEDAGGVDKKMLEKCSLYFRREKPYVNGILPLPFGIESRYLKHYIHGKEKDIDFTCVFGQDDSPPLRRQVKERLEQFCMEHNFTCHTARTKDPDEFYEILSRTKVGVSVSGGGFDTARFWEILGNNCILVTEKIDIYRQEDNAFNFKRIWEFKDIQDFEDKLTEIAHYLRNGYNQDDLDKEYKEILSQHSSKARVLTILNKAKEKNILKGHL